MDMLPIENNALVHVETPTSNVNFHPTKRRKKKSAVWEHFTIENVGTGCRRACCKQCKQSFAYSTGSKVAGTSHLKRHIAKGTCSVLFRNRNPLSSSSAQSKMDGALCGRSQETPKRWYRTNATSFLPYSSFDSESCRAEIAKMVVLHDFPLHMVEHAGFIAFAKSIQPRFDTVSFETVQGDCITNYYTKRQRVQKLLDEIPGRICLSLDLYSSCQTVGYVFVSGQFLDSDWKLHRRLLNVVMEPYPDSDSAFSHAVSSCLSDWNMEGKLFSLTVNQSISQSGLDSLRALLSLKNPLLLGGQLLLQNCLARSLGSIAQVGLKASEETVKKVRDCVKYVQTSESIEETFLELKQGLQVESTKDLVIDDITRWNTTYEMLLSALEMKDVFSYLDSSDPYYNKSPSREDWSVIETLCVYLKLLFDMANLLTAPIIPTINTFFHESWKIQLELARASTSEDSKISTITKPMREKFDEYWKNCSLTLAIAVVMDPRFKMKLVEFSFSKIYGDEAEKFIKFVDEGIHDLFSEYVSLPLPLDRSFLEEMNNGGEDVNLGLTDFDVYIMEKASQESRTELDQYLEESLLPRVHEFDLVGWWKLNKVKYPTLSKMARDILSMPVSVASHDSIFDVASQEMDQYKCYLRPETVEAVVCTKDWIWCESVEDASEVVKMEFPI